MARKKYGWRIAGFVFRGLCTLLILGVVGLIAWRIIDRSIVPSAVKTLTANEILCEAYTQNEKTLKMFFQEQNEYTQEDKNYGYFANSGTVFIDEADQVQFILRYNNSTLEYTAEDYRYYEVTDKEGMVQAYKSYTEATEAAKKIDPWTPADYIQEIIPTLPREKDVYDVTLTVMYDLTPENTEDNDGTVPEAVRYERILPSADRISYQKTLYNYRKFIFDGVEIGDNVLAVYADVYYVEDVNYEETPYGTLLLYYYEDETIEYKLSRADINAIEAYPAQ